MKMSERVDVENLVLLQQALKELKGIGIEFEEATAGLIYGRSREANFVFCRAVIAFYLRGKGMTLMMIGDILGGREHGSVINMLKYKRGRQGFDQRFVICKKKIQASFYLALKFEGYDALIEYHEKEINKLEELKRKQGNGEE